MENYFKNISIAILIAWEKVWRTNAICSVVCWISCKWSNNQQEFHRMSHRWHSHKITHSFYSLLSILPEALLSKAQHSTDTIFTLKWVKSVRRMVDLISNFRQMIWPEIQISLQRHYSDKPNVIGTWAIEHDSATPNKAQHFLRINRMLVLIDTINRA